MLEGRKTLCTFSFDLFYIDLKSHLQQWSQIDRGLQDIFNTFLQ